jgi:hypothetical protein
MKKLTIEQIHTMTYQILANITVLYIDELKKGEI